MKKSGISAAVIKADDAKHAAAYRQVKDLSTAELMARHSFQSGQLMNELEAIQEYRRKIADGEKIIKQLGVELKAIEKAFAARQ